MLINAITAIIFGVLNRLRGIGKPSKPWVALLVSVVAGGYHFVGTNNMVQAGIFGLIWGIGFLVMNIVGTGDGFAAIHGRYDGIRKYNPFNRWVYWLADKIAGKPYEDSLGILPKNLQNANKKWGFWYMTFRGLYSIVPTVALALVFYVPLLIPVGTLGFLAGPFYRLQGFFPEHKYSSAVAEVLHGLLLGLMVVLSSLLIAIK